MAIVYWLVDHQPWTLGLLAQLGFRPEFRIWKDPEGVTHLTHLNYE